MRMKHDRKAFRDLLGQSMILEVVFGNFLWPKREGVESLHMELKLIHNSELYYYGQESPRQSPSGARI